ncbi:hypothetical protein C8D99_108127 [Aminivibrio pyruvatiphilus]|uniref:Uncharacterized protein n=1 Tax=Aminivibrio pyruvatiphilus TaxID=1005740 RepID=A0A4R8M6X4_9BACT|nr:hypothetical protein C8D99_108127 [Aminivibrio pyruvatiphilus]
MVDELRSEGFTSRLVAGEGGYRILRTIAVLLLLAGCGWSGYMFRQYIELNHEEPITIPPIESQSEKDAQRLDKVIGDFRTAVDTRTRSLTLASAVIEASRQPFIPTMKVTVASQAVGEGSVTVGGEDQVIPTYVREKIPPIMFVRAIMVAGKQSMAIMDIEGVGTGIIVRSGYSFSNGEGKVVRIGPDKVTVNWSGKNLDLAPGL